MTDKNAELVAGLRALADWYEQHPDVPLPKFPKFVHCVLAGNDADGQAQVEAVAEALGAPAGFYNGSADVERKFGPVNVEVFYVSRERSAAYADDQRFLAEHKRGEA